MPSNDNSPHGSIGEFGLNSARVKGKTWWILSLITVTTATGYSAAIRSVRDHTAASGDSVENTPPGPAVVPMLSEQIATKTLFGPGATLDDLEFAEDEDGLIGFTVHHKISAALAGGNGLYRIQCRIDELLGGVGDWYVIADHIAGTIRFTRSRPGVLHESVEPTARRRVAVGQLSDTAAQLCWSTAAAPDDQPADARES